MSEKPEPLKGERELQKNYKAPILHPEKAQKRNHDKPIAQNRRFADDSRPADYHFIIQKKRDSRGLKNYSESVEGLGKLPNRSPVGKHFSPVRDPVL